ncbi:MAG: hypothetical protein NXH97_18160 [Rhodobacteraceae bacterium]|nr:hypothetical protein [Paracoccaceae bacterium]
MTIALHKRTFCDNEARGKEMVNLVEFTRVVAVLDRDAKRRVVERALQTAGLDRAMLDGTRGFVPCANEAVFGRNRLT